MTTKTYSWSSAGRVSYIDCGFTVESVLTTPKRVSSVSISKLNRPLIDCVARFLADLDTLDTLDNAGANPTELLGSEIGASRSVLQQIATDGASQLDGSEQTIQQHCHLELAVRATQLLHQLAR